MTSWQEVKRNKLLEERRAEHERYAAERLKKVNEVCALALENGMSYGHYMIERYQKMNEENIKNTEKTEPKEKRGIRPPLSPETVGRVREMLAEGVAIKDIIAETLVSRATIGRIKNGTYGVKQPKKPPKIAEPTAFTTLEECKDERSELLKKLISEAKKNLLDVSAFEHCDCKEVGYAIGLLTAAEMILGSDTNI